MNEVDQREIAWAKYVAAFDFGPSNSPRMNFDAGWFAARAEDVEHDHDEGGCTCGCPVPECMPCGVSA